MKNKRIVLSSLIFVMAVVVCLPVLAQQKKGAHKATFVGKWKLNKPKSDLTGPFPVCIFGEGDRMFSNTMTVAGNKGLLTVHVTSSSPEWEPVKRQEKLIFDGKEREATVFGRARDESTARWAHDGQTMIVTSLKSFYTKGKEPDIKVKEVWKLINDGKSISVQVNLRKEMRKLVYDKQ
ncbi:hypothetical protein [Pedobacter psychroterrae]|uniref:Lipocalin-like protein n=1 Tax=Pedobacter psychroterrae TaxID=2530453 RepID=A0A4R0NJJ1_9SPHI|nr:hypothetical protein [Pedobacter psychroterrae]TCD00379.1 hypothetical protein EZ437_14230 [Pedobacter psychroterrae]